MEKVDKAKELKEAGTVFFKAGDFKNACSKYSQAAMQLKGVTGTEDDAAVTTLQVSCYVNAAVCHNKGSEWEEAIDKAGRALKIDSKHAKALFHRCVVYPRNSLQF